MEMWEIANRTRGTVEIGCIRNIALQIGERYVFSGTCPDALRWLGNKVTLTRVQAPVSKAASTTSKKHEEEKPAKPRAAKSESNSPTTQV